jgi:hypothetical protein
LFIFDGEPGFLVMDVHVVTEEAMALNRRVELIY